MIRTAGLAGLVVLLVAAEADAGDRIGWRARRAEPQPCCAIPQARFPRLAAIAQPPGFMLPGYQLPIVDRFPSARFLPYALSTGFMVMAFFPPSYDVLGFGIPIGIRAAHVLLNGSPTPGRPLMTAGWIANAYAVQGFQWWQMRNRGIVPGIDYPVNPPLNGSNTPRLIERRYGPLVGSMP